MFIKNTFGCPIFQLYIHNSFIKINQSHGPMQQRLQKAEKDRHLEMKSGIRRLYISSNVDIMKQWHVNNTWFDITGTKEWNTWLPRICTCIFSSECLSFVCFFKNFKFQKCPFCPYFYPFVFFVLFYFCISFLSLMHVSSLPQRYIKDKDKRYRKDSDQPHVKYY